MSVDTIAPHISRAEPGIDGMYRYRNEVELTTALAAHAEIVGVPVRTQVKVFGGFADIVLEHNGGLAVVEVKLELRTPAQFSRAAEQVLGYKRSLLADDAVLVAPKISWDVAAEFRRSNPSSRVRLFEVGRYLSWLSAARNPEATAERLRLILLAAEKLIMALPVSERTIHAEVDVRAARRALAQEARS